HELNQRYLVAALARVRRALDRHAVPGEVTPEDSDPVWPAPDTGELPPPALVMLTRAFGLSPFERDVLLLAAGPELDASFLMSCAAAQGDPHFAFPTFGLALAALPGPHWSALSPAGPLRVWHLLELGVAETLVNRPLRIDERVLHYLTGVSYLDERVCGLVELVPPPSELPPSQERVADRIVEMWSQSTGVQPTAVVELCGETLAGKEAIAARACSELGLRLYVMHAADVPPTATEREVLARRWEREILLGQAALLVDCEDLTGPDENHAVQAFLARVRGPLLLTSREPLPLRRRRTVCLDVRRPSAGEQRALWRNVLGGLASRLDGRLDPVVAQFNLETASIQAASGEVLADDGNRDVHADVNALSDRLWEICRVCARGRLGELAQRIDPIACWDDLVLPPVQKDVLRQIIAQARQRLRVYEDWGFAARSGRGLGMSALFAGPSGTGKTLAAEVLAGELRLDLYRIDLSQVVSKYIGETEKNLRRVFDAAEESGAILLFDEADALFGKRSEVKDSHDRYANVEVSYLLQRMEEYRGLAILTTNLKNALDPAFLRRLRFVVQFPFPDYEQRQEIWQRSFPSEAPIDGLNFTKLARLNVAGGSIRNIAVGAAFLAADAGEPIRMSHVLRAAQAEYVKLEKSLTEAEVGGWV
ncbi:MAG TPA: ATP-binding protein, partial [Chloroflexota bacterium]|nr:ATP-binding protein [Chloroflexota bacterium]